MSTVAIARVPRFFLGVIVESACHLYKELVAFKNDKALVGTFSKYCTDLSIDQCQNCGALYLVRNDAHVSPCWPLIVTCPAIRLMAAP